AVFSRAATPAARRRGPWHDSHGASSARLDDGDTGARRDDRRQRHRADLHSVVPGKKPAPLVLILHGNTQQGADMQRRSSWPEIARREQFIAIYPDGLNRAWADLRGSADVVGRRPPDGTDDVAALTALVEKYIKDGAADPKRIYVTGVSNGGAMAMSLACRAP